ncbi:MAG TPA: DegT/DnrJ/EryC1/StrS family aminotransferase [Terriglobales bacterium]|nr:DegT/DnrJ/EryC1/StrS family aminotransferase [Terriglobales bacterium]
MSTAIAATRKISFLDLKKQLAPLRPEIDDAIRQVLDNTSFINGPFVSKFEAEFAKYCHTRFCVGMNSGTDALRFALMAAGIGPGDEVITAANTFIATTEAISQCGATPVLVDVRPDTFLIDPAQVERKITPKTRALLPVHLYGQPADMDELAEIAKRRNLLLFEDACQAHGSEYKGKRAGSIGLASGFSFYPGKNLGAFGDAGSANTNDPEIERKMRLLKDHGQSQKYVHDIEGYNGRLDALQAAVLSVKLKHLDSWNAARRRNAAMYAERLKNSPQIQLPVALPDRTHAFHLFVVHVKNRDAVRTGLAEMGIDTGLHYPIPLHQQKAYAAMPFAKEKFPVTEKSAAEMLSLPMFAELSESDIDYVCDGLKRMTAKN